MFYLSLPVDLWCAAMHSSSFNNFFYRYVFGLCCIEEFFNDRTFKELCVCVCVCVCVCLFVVFT